MAKEGETIEIRHVSNGFWVTHSRNRAWETDYEYACKTLEEVIQFLILNWGSQPEYLKMIEKEKDGENGQRMRFADRRGK